jgi:uncharacterized protein
MQYNVAQLLKEPTGSSRSYQLDEFVGDVDRPADHLRGLVRLLKTHHGVLVKGRLEVDARLTCGRCLGEFPLNMNLSFEEEFFPAVDAKTGSRLSPPDGPESVLLESVLLESVLSEGVLIDEAHTLDLTEVVRQYIITNWPMKPLCRPECGGLCPDCGANLNLEECQCRQPSRDPRWGDLAGWLRQGQN